MKKLNVRSVTISSIFCLSMLAANSANAALVNFSVDGEITDASSSYFGLSVGDTITATGQYDDSPIGAGSMFVDFTFTYNNMEITVGNTVFTDEMDVLGGASLYFLDGNFDGLDYKATTNAFISYGYLGRINPETGEPLSDFTGKGIAGNWIADSFQVTPVPVPAAVWLFGSGLLLLGGIGRKAQQKAA